MYKSPLIFGTFFCALSVILGAFGAHALKEVLSAELLNSFETGVRYQFYHGMALLVLGVLVMQVENKFLRWACNSFVLGIVLFSGSIYALVSLKSQGQIGLGGLGIITPIGGMFFVAAWLLMLYGIVRLPKK